MPLLLHNGKTGREGPVGHIDVRIHDGTLDVDEDPRGQVGELHHDDRGAVVGLTPVWEVHARVTLGREIGQVPHVLHVGLILGREEKIR